jgi:ketosteroid isomerase-like protein
VDDFAALFAAWRAGDAAAAVAWFAPDGIYREARQAPIAGRAAIAAHWTAFFTGGPPWRIEIGEIFSDAAGAHFAIPYVFEIQGKDGVWQSRPGCALVRVSAGLIAEWREYSG